MPFSFDKFMTGLSSGLAQNKGTIGGFGQGFTGSYNTMKGLANQEAEQNAVSKILSGDETGWQDWGKVNPQGAMNAWNTQKKLEQLKNGGAWNTDLGRMYKIANDPNETPENKAIATQYLQYTTRNPIANQSWSQAGRIGQLQGDLALAPQVEAEKTLAREKAQNKAEVDKKAENLKRNMPSFYDMADELIDLADKATYNKTGRTRDLFLREAGLPMSEAGKAREKYDEIVKNELLPKLRETFGGQLSDSEREALLGTLGNVNLAPEEKKQAVRAFIESKERQLKSYGFQPKREQVKQEEIIDWRDI